MNRHERRAARAHSKQQSGLAGLHIVEFGSAFPGKHSLSDLHDFTKQMVSEKFTDPGHPMTFLAMSSEGQWKGITPAGFGEDDRALLRLFLRHAFGELGIAMYAGIVECWVTDYVPGDTSPVRPSQDPARREMLLVGAADDAGGKKVGSFEIKRSGDGSPRLESWEDGEFSSAWWLCLLDPEPKVH